MRAPLKRVGSEHETTATLEVCTRVGWHQRVQVAINVDEPFHPSVDFAFPNQKFGSI